MRLHVSVDSTLKRTHLRCSLLREQCMWLWRAALRNPRLAPLLELWVRHPDARKVRTEHAAQLHIGEHASRSVLLRCLLESCEALDRGQVDLDVRRDEVVYRRARRLDLLGRLDEGQQLGGLSLLVDRRPRALEDGVRALDWVRDESPAQALRES